MQNATKYAEMFRNVLKCSEDVTNYSEMFWNVLKCLEMFGNVWKCSEMFWNVLNCLEKIRIVRECLEMSKSVLKWSGKRHLSEILSDENIKPLILWLITFSKIEIIKPFWYRVLTMMGWNHSCETNDQYFQVRSVYWLCTNVSTVEHMNALTLNTDHDTTEFATSI